MKVTLLVSSALLGYKNYKKKRPSLWSFYRLVQVSFRSPTSGETEAERGLIFAVWQIYPSTTLSYIKHTRTTVQRACNRVETRQPSGIQTQTLDINLQHAGQALTVQQTTYVEGVLIQIMLCSGGPRNPDNKNRWVDYLSLHYLLPLGLLPDLILP